MRCPRCGSSVSELLACDVCEVIGCIHCITRYGKQWVCEKCKSEYKQTPESALASMFG